ESRTRLVVKTTVTVKAQTHGAIRHHHRLVQRPPPRRILGNLLQARQRVILHLQELSPHVVERQPARVMLAVASRRQRITHLLRRGVVRLVQQGRRLASTCQRGRLPVDSRRRLQPRRTVRHTHTLLSRLTVSRLRAQPDGNPLVPLLSEASLLLRRQFLNHSSNSFHSLSTRPQTGFPTLFQTWSPTGTKTWSPTRPRTRAGNRIQTGS